MTIAQLNNRIAYYCDELRGTLSQQRRAIIAGRNADDWSERVRTLRASIKVLEAERNALEKRNGTKSG